MKPEQVINQDPEIHGGTPVFTGTRVPIKALIDHLKAGESLDYFLEGFPNIVISQILSLYREKTTYSGQLSSGPGMHEMRRGSSGTSNGSNSEVLLA